jgi:hypothetical protein
MRNRYQFKRFKAPLHIVAANDNHKPDGPKGPRPVSKLTDAELANLEENFVKKGVTESPNYKLKDVRREILRRATKGLDGGEVVSHILALAAASRDYLTTYGALHSKLWDNKRFIGHHSMNETMTALRAAAIYCVKNGLPCMTTLVVEAKTRSLSPRAAFNIVETLKGLGVEVGANVEDYVLEQTLAAMDVVAQSTMATAA